MSEQQQERSAALVAWEREDAERQMRSIKQYPYPATPPDAVLNAAAGASMRSFGAVWLKLSASERAAEYVRVNTRLRDDPVGSYIEVNYFNNLVVNFHAQEMSSRGSVEREGSALADKALGRCRYLGGFAGYPNPAETSAAFCYVHSEGGLNWVDRRDNTVAWVSWPDVLEMRVGPSDRSQQRVTAPRVALFGVFALGAKKQRREAMLAVRTPTGEGVFTVYGRTPLQLQAALAPLISRIGETTSSQHLSSSMSTGIDPQLLENASSQLMASLTRGAA